MAQTNALPSLLPPCKDANGRIIKRNGFTTYQYQPSDHPNFTHKYESNVVDSFGYTIDELLYTVNRNNFRADQFSKNDNSNALMCAGCSFTFGIGLRNHEVWPKLVAEKLNMVNWNVGVGGIGVETTTLIIKQFFELGYIPKVLAVMWPNIHRKLVASNDLSIDSAIENFIINGSEKNIICAHDFLLSNGIPYEGFSANMQLAMKGTLMQTSAQRLLEFLINRELIILLCEKHNVLMVEMLPSPDSDTILSRIKQSNYSVPRIPYTLGQRNARIDWSQKARDGAHFGYSVNKRIAEDFIIAINKAQ